MIGGPSFKSRRSLLRRESVPRSREHNAFNHGKQVFLDGHSVCLRLGQESRFNVRLDIQSDGHRFLYDLVYACLAVRERAYTSTVNVASLRSTGR